MEWLILLLAMLPGRVRLEPAWVPREPGAPLLVPMTGARPSTGEARAIKIPGGWREPGRPSGTMRI
jgi:hypothetical protein